MSINVFDYKNLLVYFKELLEHKKSLNRNYSMRAWSVSLGFKNPSFLSQCLKGQRTVNHELIKKIVDRESLSDFEKDYLYFLWFKSCLKNHDENFFERIGAISFPTKCCKVTLGNLVKDLNDKFLAISGNDKAGVDRLLDKVFIDDFHSNIELMRKSIGVDVKLEKEDQESKAHLELSRFLRNVKKEGQDTWFFKNEYLNIDPNKMYLLQDKVETFLTDIRQLESKDKIDGVVCLNIGAMSVLTRELSTEH